MSAVYVLKPGMFTTIQDRGRWGFQAFGVPVAGPMDPCALRLANAAVGNPPDTAALEVTVVGPELEFEDDRVVAIAGACFELALDGTPVDDRTAFTCPAGSRLRFGQRKWGARAYLGIAGGFDSPLVFGSRATHGISQMGGVDGKPVRGGDRLPLGIALGQPRYRPIPRQASRGEVATVRVMPGPQADRFVTGSLDTLQSAPYQVGPASGRMGFRLQGPPLSHARGADIISDATPLGSIQVPASGQPILLMADRQTTGGYPKIATMISADVGVAGQLAPGDRIAFAVCTPAEAMSALIAQERALMAFES